MALSSSNLSGHLGMIRRAHEAIRRSKELMKRTEELLRGSRETLRVKPILPWVVRGGGAQNSIIYSANELAPVCPPALPDFGNSISHDPISRDFARRKA